MIEYYIRFVCLSFLTHDAWVTVFVLCMGRNIKDLARPCRSADLQSSSDHLTILVSYYIINDISIRRVRDGAAQSSKVGLESSTVAEMKAYIEKNCVNVGPSVNSARN